jgi:hypothetical protein
MSANDVIADVFAGKANYVYKQLTVTAAGRDYTIREAFAIDAQGSLLPIMGDIFPHWIDLDNFDQITDGELAWNCLCRDWGRENNLDIRQANVALIAKVRDEGDEIPLRGVS